MKSMKIVALTTNYLLLGFQAIILFSYPGDTELLAGMMILAIPLVVNLIYLHKEK